jgi:hypothetical protein
MPSPLTIADIITNALDKDYSVEQAATDPGGSMTELELIKRKYGADSSRLTELQRTFSDVNCCMNRNSPRTQHDHSVLTPQRDCVYCSGGTIGGMPCL